MQQAGGEWRSIGSDPVSTPLRRPPLSAADVPVRRLRTTGMGSLADEGGRIVRRYGRVLFVVTALLLIPRAVLDLLSARAAYDALSNDDGAIRSLRPMFDRLFLLDFDVSSAVFAAITNSISVALIGGFVALIVCSHQLGQAVDTAELLRRTVRKSPTMIAAWSISHCWWLLVFWAAMAGIEAAAWVAVLLSVLIMVTMFVVPAVVIEGLGPIRALQRSFRLFRADGGRSCGALIIAILLHLAIRLGFELIPWAVQQLLAFGSDRFSWIFDGLTGTAANVVTTPIVAAITATLYLDIRVRNEGLDLIVEADRVFAA